MNKTWTVVYVLDDCVEPMTEGIATLEEAEHVAASYNVVAEQAGMFGRHEVREVVAS